MQLRDIVAEVHRRDRLGDDAVVAVAVAVSGRATGERFATTLAHDFTVGNGAIFALDEHFDSGYFAGLLAGPA